MEVINAEKLVELQKSGVKVVDVRRPEEFAEGRIPGAVNVTLSENFAELMAEFDKNESVIVYCRSGRRSTNAANQLQSAGYTKVLNYTGSYLDWSGSNRPIEKD